MNLRASGPLALEMQGVTTRFDDLVANEAVDLRVEQGRVLALLGENGAGKTTLMNVLFGHVTPDEGQVFVNGRRLAQGSPRAAVAAGVRMVHQHFALVERHTVLENILLGTRSLSSPRLNARAARDRIGEVSARYRIDVDPTAPVWTLSLGQKQRVEILKALYSEPSLLILDEPTPVLSPREADDLLGTMRLLAESGIAIVFITHKLDEVVRVADWVTVMRAGRVVADEAKGVLDVEQLATMMIGSELPASGTPVPTRDRQPGLRVRGLCTSNKEQRIQLAEVDLEVRRGEIVGVAGVSGNGQASLMSVLSGMQHPSAGSVDFCGRSYPIGRPDEIRRLPAARIPEDRHAQGIYPDMPLWATLLAYEVPQLSRHGILRRKSVRDRCLDLMATYDIRAGSWDVPTSALSGGNMQKAILARELEQRPVLVLASYPTRGLDVAAAAAIRRRLVDQRNGGAAVLVISDDLDELLELSDRIVVMAGGRIAGGMDRDVADPEEIGMLMSDSVGRRT